MSAAIADQITQLLRRWEDREKQMRDWLGGTPTGGPNGDGRYPLTDYGGVEYLVPCPAALADSLGGPAERASQSAAASQQALATVASLAAQVASGVTALADSREALVGIRETVKQYRDRAAAAEAAAAASAQSIQSLGTLLRIPEGAPGGVVRFVDEPPTSGGADGDIWLVY